MYILMCNWSCFQFRATVIFSIEYVTYCVDREYICRCNWVDALKTSRDERVREVEGIPLVLARAPVDMPVARMNNPVSSLHLILQFPPCLTDTGGSCNANFPYPPTPNTLWIWHCLSDSCSNFPCCNLNRVAQHTTCKQIKNELKISY
jgi:hypothetical protein